jgi:hypothetical protein
VVTIVAVTIGLVIWLVGWALGYRSDDSALLALVVIIPAAAWQIFGPGIKRMIGGEPPPSTADEL